MLLHSKYCLKLINLVEYLIRTLQIFVQMINWFRLKGFKDVYLTLIQSKPIFNQLCLMDSYNFHLINEMRFLIWYNSILFSGLSFISNILNSFIYNFGDLRVYRVFIKAEPFIQFFIIFIQLLNISLNPIKLFSWSRLINFIEIQK